MYKVNGVKPLKALVRVPLVECLVNNAVKTLDSENDIVLGDVSHHVIAIFPKAIAVVFCVKPVMSNPTEVTGDEGMTTAETANGDFLPPKPLAPRVKQCASQITAEAAGLKKKKLTTAQNDFEHTEYYDIATGAVQIPPDPPLTFREIICLHSKISTLATKMGLTWMDAMRELYMLEIAKLEAKGHASNAFTHLRERADGLRREVKE
ncbi:hypothetical protein DXG01_005925 [Tephrocybe rancida]|nr:hypothetical protein DXG01_005925 [Tephrocybe rancida]